MTKHNFQFLCIWAWMGLCVICLHADVKSTADQIKFDVNFDGKSEMVLDTRGLGIGVSSGVSANLHVSGNAKVSHKTLVGGGENTSQSNLHINGTMSLVPQSVSTGSQTIHSTLVLADTSSGNVLLNLPPLSESVGMSITIKRTNQNNEVFLSTSGSNVDGTTSIVLNADSYQSMTLFNNGSSWWVLNDSENSSLQEIASSNIFLWWDLNQTSGNVLSDQSSNSRSGHLTNSHLFSGNSVSGPLSSALLLSSSNVSALYDDGNLPSASYSYALWANYNFSSNASLGYEPYIDGAAGFVWASGNTKFHKSAYHQLNDSSYVTTALSSELNANTWYHIGVTWDGQTVSLYLDGEFQSGNAATNWIGASNIRLTNPGTHDTGASRADDMRFYDKALTSDEMKALYLTGQP